MRVRSEIIRRIEECEFRSQEYETKAARCKNEASEEYWLEQSAVQYEIAHVLKWVLEEESKDVRTSGVFKTCILCKKPFDGIKTPYLTYNDIFNEEFTYHIKCWNLSVFGELYRD